jgi:hypothetical protein
VPLCTRFAQLSELLQFASLIADAPTAPFTPRLSLRDVIHKSLDIVSTTSQMCRKNFFLHGYYVIVSNKQRLVGWWKLAQVLSERGR